MCQVVAGSQTPSQLTWAVSLPVGCCHPHPRKTTIAISPKPDTHFTVPQRMEG